MRLDEGAAAVPVEAGATVGWEAASVAVGASVAEGFGRLLGVVRLRRSVVTGFGDRRNRGSLLVPCEIGNIWFDPTEKPR